MLVISIFIGIVFGFIAALMAFVITWHEYAKHKLTKERLLKETFKSAIFAFIIFLFLSILVGFLFRIS